MLLSVYQFVYFVGVWFKIIACLLPLSFIISHDTLNLIYCFWRPQYTFVFLSLDRSATCILILVFSYD